MIGLRPKLAIVYSVAAASVGLATPHGALAAFTVTEKLCSGEGVPTLCVELAGKLYEAQGEESYTGKLVPGTHITFKVPLAEVTITCGKDASSGTVVQTEPGVKAVVANGILTLSECVLTSGPPSCTIKSAETSKMLNGTVVDTMPIDAGVVKPATGSVLIELEWLGPSCSLKGKHSITGTDECFSPEAETDQVVHVGECVEKGSHLNFLSDPAIFECLAESMLSGINKEMKWDVTLA